MSSKEPPSYSEQKQLEQRRESFINRPLPNAEDAERVVICAIILQGDVIAAVIEQLVPEDFYSPLHRRIYSAMVALYTAGSDVTPIHLIDQLKKEGNPMSMGGMSAIMGITHGLPHYTDLSAEVKLIKEKSKVRSIIHSMGSLQSALINEDDIVEDLLYNVETKVFEFADTFEESASFLSITDLIPQRIEVAHHVQSTGNPVTGISTGFTDVDSILAGLHRKNLIIIGARPSMGKTALVMKIGQNTAFRFNLNAIVFSLEMSKEELTARIITSESGVDSQKFRTGLMSPEDWEAIEEARAYMGNGNLLINDEPDMSVAKIRHKLRRLRKQNVAIDLVIIDYLQLMSHHERVENRQQEMTKISRSLKILAKEFDVPVIALSQLSRNPENRAANNHRPQLGDLRESGAIEQDADVVALLYREEMYPKSDGSIVGQGEAELIIAKQRNGPTGTVKLAFDKASTGFGDFIPSF